MCFGMQGTAWPAEQPSFTDITQASGIAQLVTDHYAAHPTGWLSGLHLVDLDADGDLDLFLSAHGKGDSLAALNDGLGHYSAPDGNCRIYRHDGAMNFPDVTAEAGLPGAGTAIKGVGDVDQDGDPDLICLEHKQHFEIYVNDGTGRFVKKDRAIQGIEKGAAYASWGIAVTTDFDNDGVADILVNGKHFLKILKGTGGGSFQYVNAIWGIGDVSAASIDDGLCFGDIDADGDLDIVGYTSIDGQRRFAVYRNDLPVRNRLRVRLTGSPGNQAAAGAKIRVYTPGGDRLLWYEQVAVYDSQAAASYYALPVTERHFGLGKRQTVDVSVEFYPSRRLVWKRGVNANETVEIHERSTDEEDRRPQ